MEPSNWFKSTSTSNFTIPGAVPSSSTAIATQHLDWGNEDVEMDITNFVNNYITTGITTGVTTGVTTGTTTTYFGFCLKFSDAIEALDYSIEQKNFALGLFTRHTQTFFEPFIETHYNDHIEDEHNARKAVQIVAYEIIEHIELIEKAIKRNIAPERN